jgi:hypothetical protein
MPRSKKTPEKKVSTSTRKKSSTHPPVKTQPKSKNNVEVLEKKEELKFHQVFPIKLEHSDKQLKEKKVCFFQCKEHLNSYIKRYNLKKTEYIISDTEPR